MNLFTQAMNRAYESEPEKPCLVGYVLNRERTYNPPPRHGQMFDYVLADDGIYLHAEREEMHVCFKIAHAPVRGLGECFELFGFKLPLVPASVVREILDISLRYAQDSKETLFWLEHSYLNPYDNGWLLRQPEQKRTAASCLPAEGQEEAYSRAIIEIHSHHKMAARFSPIDDDDETGFRVYGVIGRLPGQPKIRFRVGVYGAGFWEIPAGEVMELPAGLIDFADFMEGDGLEKEESR
jgi:PRTRC genetic system protein A